MFHMRCVSWENDLCLQRFKRDASTRKSVLLSVQQLCIMSKEEETLQQPNAMSENTKFSNTQTSGSMEEANEKDSGARNWARGGAAHKAQERA